MTDLISVEATDPGDHGRRGARGVLSVTRDGHRIGELIPLRRRRRSFPGRNSPPCRATLRLSIPAPSGLTRTPRRITRRPTPMNGERHRQGMLDTNIVILRRWIDPGELPDEVAISAITLAELSAGPHQVRRNDEQDRYDEHAERARRLEILQRTENEFDPVPFDAEAARLFGRVTAAVIAAGRTRRRRVRRPDDRRYRDRRRTAALHHQPR